jgi:N-acyl-D-aspartate/D-glutamate deacylase
VTPFDGDLLKGMPVGTIVRGQIVMREGQLVGQAAGRMVRPNVGPGAGSREREAVAVG